MEVVFLGVLLVLFICAYVYFGFTDPDALRSEHYALSKLRIERGVLGDSVGGLRDENGADSTALVVEHHNVKDSGQ